MLWFSGATEQERRDAVAYLALAADEPSRADDDQYATFVRCLFPQHFAGRKVRKDLRAALAEAHAVAGPTLVDLALQIAIAAADELTADEITDFLAEVPPVDLGVDLGGVDIPALREDLGIVLRRFEPGKHRSSLLASLVDEECLRVLEHLPPEEIPDPALAYFARHRDPRLRAIVAQHADDPELLRATMRPSDVRVDDALAENPATPEPLLLRIAERTRPAQYRRLQAIAEHARATAEVRARAATQVHRIEEAGGELPYGFSSVSAAVDRAVRDDERAMTPSAEPPVIVPAAELATWNWKERHALAKATTGAEQLEELAHFAVAGAPDATTLFWGDDPVVSAIASNNHATDDALITMLAREDAIDDVVRRRDLSARVVEAAVAVVQLPRHAAMLAGEPGLTADAARILLERFDDPDVVGRVARSGRLEPSQVRELLERALNRAFPVAHEVADLLEAPGVTDDVRLRFLDEHYDPTEEFHVQIGVSLAMDPDTSAEVLTALLERTPSPGAEYQNGRPTRGVIRGQIGRHPNAPEQLARRLLDDPDVSVIRDAAYTLGDEDAFLKLLDADWQSANRLCGDPRVTAQGMPRLTERLLAHPDEETRALASVLIDGVDPEIGERYLRLLTDSRGDEVRAAVFGHERASQEIRDAIIRRITIDTAPAVIELARTTSDWESLLAHGDPHVAMLAATDPFHPAGVGRVPPRAPAVVNETAEAVLRDIPLPEAHKKLQWSELPNLDDVPFDLAPEIAALDGRQIEVDGRPYVMRAMTDGARLRENADFMGNCTNDGWRQGIRDGQAAVFAIEDAETGETVWNAGLRAEGNRWRLAEVNGRFNGGAPSSLRGAVERLTPDAFTPPHEVREARRRRECDLHPLS